MLDLKDLPKLGEYVSVENIDGTTEQLKAVLFSKFLEPIGYVITFFASDDLNNNIYNQKGIEYCTARLYSDPTKPKPIMRDEFLFKKLIISDTKKSYVKVLNLVEE